jgi:hypothetical protein
MAVYSDWERMRIFKQIYVDNLESCANNEYESPFTWRFVNISNYTYIDNDGDEQIINYYPFNKCCDDKFTIAARGKGKKKQSWDAGYMKVQTIWDNVFYYFYDSDDTINAAAWDFLYINKWDLSWQIVPLSGSTSIDWHQWVETIFAWTWVNLQDSADFWLSTPHWRTIYNWYGDILNFVTADWLMHLNYSYEKPSETEVTICWSMYTNTNNLASQPGFLISSMLLYKSMDAIALYDVSDWDVKFWLNWYLKFYFKATNQFYISNDFTDMVEFTGYLILMGPSRTWLSFPYPDSEHPWVVKNQYRDIWDWYLTRWSRVSDSSTFIMANSTWLWALGIEVSYWVSDINWFTINRTFQSWPFSTDISHFSREQWDKMGMSMQNKQFKMFITNEEWTMIWIKSIEHNYRRQHIFGDRQIKKFKSGIYIGDGIYGRWWDEEIKTYLSFWFWDKTMLVPKLFHSLKLALGRDSRLTKGNTVLQITYTLSWRTYTVNYWDRDTSFRIQEMMNLKLSGNTDEVFREYGNEIEVSSWQWHGKKTPDLLWNTNKIKAFKAFDPHVDNASWFEDEYKLANWSTIHTDLGSMGDMINFRLITKGKDNFEFYWAQIWYELTNEIGWSIDNSLVIKASADDGSSPIIPK